jgi:hypothetical protein
MGTTSQIEGQESTAKPNGAVVVAPPTQVPAAPMSDAAALMQVIANAATNPAVDIDKLERLMQMHERINAQRARSEYMAALAEMQPNLPAIERKGKITIKDKNDNKKVIQETPFAKWEDIDAAIKPILGKHGFALSFRTGLASDGRLTVTAILSHRGGHQEETMMVLPYDSSGSKNNVQAIGSSTSYGKRYTACALLNISSRDEDDDGNTAQPEASITDEQANTILSMLSETGTNAKSFCNHFGIEGVALLPAKKFKEAFQALSARKRVK